MVKAQKTDVKLAGSRSGTEGVPVGSPSVSPPSSNTGGTGGSASRGSVHQSGTDEARERLNLSISPQLRISLEVAARFLGMSASQVALFAIIQGMPELEKQAKAMSVLANNARQFQGKGGD